MRRVLCVGLLACLVLSASADAQQPPPTAAALSALRRAAEHGDAQAQLDYAEALDPNTAEAHAWAQKAADQGLAEAWFWLGYHAPGDAAAPFYEKAARAGDRRAFPYVFERLLFRAGRAADVARARQFADLARANDGSRATSEDEQFLTIDRCADAGDVLIPPGDEPTAQERATLGTATCVSFLEGVGVTKDLATYRKCLLSEDPVDNNLLAEVYANGWGVVRNARLAIALACHGSDVPAELIDIVSTLHETRAQLALDEPFLFCNHATSGLSAGRCAARDEELQALTRKAALASLTASWPRTHVDAFERLQAAAEHFFTTRAHAEIDMTGTMRAALATEEQSRLRNGFLAAIRKAAAGTLPRKFTLATADADLNRAYGDVMRAALDLGTVTHDTVRETQRAWLAYRDAWGMFGALHFPGRTADEWKAWATRERTAQLRSILDPGQ